MGNKKKAVGEMAQGMDSFLPLEGSNVDHIQPQSVKKKVQKGGQMGSDEKKPTVLYIGHIPHGFYEEQMRGFFSQFGTIKRLRISRNKKTGNSRHYGFIEFESPEVAEIVADCMHNYLLFEHILKVRLVPSEEIHPKLWERANCKFKPIKWQQIERKRHNRERTVEEQQRLIKAIMKNDAIRRKKIQAAGIEYEYPELIGTLPPIPKKIKFSDEED
ncbi:uncharacterized RNA-binding protein C1827.05c [Cryptomeria japonica]|uniref:uncharacterized RNA-binding protein C1827.05c n=1 Tax=Cryptomeria japonica TaxID=3369 RepID=UPI0027DA9219|nr:uncharacterized RNA-binding protein C1827.05c [Cryptomeria japonica]